MRSGSSLKAWKCGVASATLALFLQGTPAIAQVQTHNLNIPAQDLGGALRAVARATRQEIAFETSQVRGKRAAALRGTYTAQAAVETLLAGTDLTLVTGRSGLLIVRPRNQSATTTTGLLDPEEEISTELPEVLVRGSRSLNVDVRRTEDDAQPYVVFGREDIASSQAVTVEDFLRSRLPQNTSSASQSQATGLGRPYSSFNLRGLGVDQTLILVNGRRLAGLANQDSAPGQSDINGIPVGSIERIEILPSSAGGIYGGNAVGGVINIILRRDYRGVETTLAYNDTFDGAAPSERIDVNGGFALEDGRTTLTFGASVSRSGTLRVGDRPGLIQDGINLGRSNVSPYVATTPPLGNGVNIRSSNGTNLVLDPRFGGRNLGSAVTNLPIGYAGPASDNGALLLANAGAYNLDIPNTLSGLQRGLLTSPEIRSFNLGVRRSFASWLDGFVDYSHLENKGTSYSANQVPTTVTLAANAPTNPFQQAIRVTFPTPGLSFPYVSESRTDTVAVGAIVRLPRKWALNLEMNKTWTENGSVFYQSVVDFFGVYCGLQAAADPANCTGRPVLDPLQSPVNFGDYLFSDPTFLGGPYGSTFTNPSVRASGPIFKLPGGSAVLTLAVQQEASEIERSYNSIIDTQTREWLYLVYTGREQRTTSTYAELVMPFVEASNSIPFVRELELRGAVRRDSYITEAPPFDAGFFQVADPDDPLPPYELLRTRFDSTNYTVAGRYTPVEGITFRASFATGFLPPNVVQLADQSIVAPVGLSVPDPFRGNELQDYAIDVVGGSGSLLLKPEESESLSVGVILTPLRGLRLSVDWTRIEKTGEIGSIPTAYLFANPDLFPGRVVRAAPAAGDPAGYAGRIISVDLTPINMLYSEFETVDFQIDYEWETAGFGAFRFYALAAWQPDAVRQLIVGAPALNYAGNRDGPLEWRANGGVDWEGGAWRVRWNTQFYDSYNVFGTQNADTPAGAAAIQSAITLQGGRRIPSQSYSDLNVSYAFDRGILEGVRLSAGVQNIFNQTPPVIATQSYLQAGYSTYGDPRLRRFSIALTKTF